MGHIFNPSSTIMLGCLIFILITIEQIEIVDFMKYLDKHLIKQYKSLQWIEPIGENSS